MNIFFLHFNPQICAKMHVDKHVIKLILESAQMLCTTWHVIDPEHKLYTPPYKIAHKNHPCTIWVRSSVDNYNWLCNLGIELCLEYTYRYGKIHKSESIIRELAKLTPPLPEIGFTTPAQAMPDIYKEINNPIDAYRTYYFFDKHHILSWKGKINGREIPDWIIEIKNLFDE